MPRGTQVPPASFSVSNTRLSLAMARLSSRLLLPTPESLTAALQPHMVETTWFGLFPFRSPLLWESRLISFPPGTEMFHFPGSASSTLWIHVEIPEHDFRWVPPFRDPRIKGCLAPPRGLSQLATSFFAVQRQGIHLLPLLTCSLKNFLICLFNCQ